MSTEPFKLLNKAVERGQERMNLVTKEEWAAAMIGFPDQARYHCANLAAHNWDVALVGERLLVTSPWSGGSWLSKDGTRTKITQQELELLYPVVEAYSKNGTRTYENEHTIWRQCEISLDGLAAIAAETLTAEVVK